MVVTEYKVGDLIVDDRDKAVGLIYAVELRCNNEKIYKVYWLDDAMTTPYTGETSKGIKTYRKLA